MPRVRKGTKSDTRIDTTLKGWGQVVARLTVGLQTNVCIPPPPRPANALDAMSSGMFLARPEKRFPSANIVYANSRQDFRPKMSLSLP